MNFNKTHKFFGFWLPKADAAALEKAIAKTPKIGNRRIGIAEIVRHGIDKFLKDSK